MPPRFRMSESLELFKHTLARARAKVAKIIIGQHEVINACLLAIFTGQHVLRERAPGVGKTQSALLPSGLAHRLILRPEYEIEHLPLTEALQKIIEKVPVPQ